MLLDTVRTVPQIEIQAELATIRNGAILAEVSAVGKLTFRNAVTGQVLIEEEEHLLPFGWPPTRGYKQSIGGLFKLEVRFLPNDGERFYGLGQQIHGKLDQKGCTIELLHRNTQLSIPFLLSNRGYGFLWHNPAVGRVQLGYDRTLWVAEACSQMDYWITAGESPAEIVNNTWTPPATRRCCRSGPPGSGSASCATSPRMNS